MKNSPFFLNNVVTVLHLNVLWFYFSLKSVADFIKQKNTWLTRSNDRPYLSFIKNYKLIY